MGVLVECLLGGLGRLRLTCSLSYCLLPLRRALMKSHVLSWIAFILIRILKVRLSLLDFYPMGSLLGAGPGLRGPVSSRNGRPSNLVHFGEMHSWLRTSNRGEKMYF